MQGARGSGVTRRAIVLGAVVAITLFAFMIYDGWFMKGDYEVECLPYAQCEAAEKAEAVE
jgi:hypothetical protein